MQMLLPPPTSPGVPAPDTRVRGRRRPPEKQPDLWRSVAPDDAIRDDASTRQGNKSTAARAPAVAVNDIIHSRSCDRGAVHPKGPAAIRSAHTIGGEDVVTDSSVYGEIEHNPRPVHSEIVDERVIQNPWAPITRTDTAAPGAGDTGAIGDLIVLKYVVSDGRR